MPSRWLIPGAFLLVYAYSFPYFGALKSANELPRIFLTTEMIDRGTFRIDARLDELGSRFDVATTPDGHHYSNKAPGLSFFAVPTYLALKGWHALAGGEPSVRELTWAFRFTVVTVPAVLFLPLFLAFARRFARREEPRRAALVAYALGSMAVPYSILFFSHQLAAVLVAGSFVAAVALVRGDAAHPARWALATGALAGFAVLTDYQSAFAGLIIGGYLLLRSRHRVRDAGLALCGSLPAAALLAWYHWAAFGSPLTTGYSFAADPAHTRGVLGIIGPNREAMYNALLAPDNGLILLSPWVLLAVAGGVIALRDRDLRARAGAEIGACAAIAALYVLFVGSLVPAFGRAGWSVGPRYIAVAMPFLAWLTVPAFARADDNRFARWLVLTPVWVGVIVFVTAAATYPHWPTSFAHPLYEVSFRAIREGLAPHSLGTLMSLPGWLAYLPLFAGVVALGGWLLARRDRSRWIVAMVALATALLVVAWYRTLAHSGPAQERPWRFIERTWEPMP